MKKIFLSVLLLVVGFSAFAQSKVIQKSSIDDVNIRWIHNQKTNQDYIELCRSPKFDEVVYRYSVGNDLLIEGLIPVLESVQKALDCVQVDIEGVKVNNLSKAYSFGVVYALFTACCTDIGNIKKYYNLDWCTCLVVYNDFKMTNINQDHLDDLIDSVEDLIYN